MAAALVPLAGTSWLPPGRDQPYLHGRVEAALCDSRAESYADRPAVAAPHALHVMGLTPQARAHHLAAVAAGLVPSAC